MHHGMLHKDGKHNAHPSPQPALSLAGWPWDTVSSSPCSSNLQSIWHIQYSLLPERLDVCQCNVFNHQRGYQYVCVCVQHTIFFSQKVTCICSIPQTLSSDKLPVYATYNIIYHTKIYKNVVHIEYSLSRQKLPTYATKHSLSTQWGNIHMRHKTLIITICTYIRHKQHFPQL